MRVLLPALVFASLFAAVAMQAYVLLFDGRHLVLLGLFVLASAATALATVRVQGWWLAKVEARAPRERAPSRRRGKRSDAGKAPRETGTVKWFSPDKGYGFVVRASGEEIFVHHSAIRGRRDAAKTLADGQPVTFVAVERERGLQAADVEAKPPA